MVRRRAQGQHCRRQTTGADRLWCSSIWLFMLVRMPEPPGLPGPAAASEPADHASDAAREFDAGRARLVGHLVDDGFSPQRAAWLVDSWEAEAARRGIPLGSPAYWRLAPAWLASQAAENRDPPEAIRPLLVFVVVFGLIFGLFVFQFVDGMLRVALGLAEWPAFLIACAIVGGLVVMLVRRTGAWSGMRGLPQRTRRRRGRSWGLWRRF